MASCTVLISGAGIAGCTLAYWMARNGWSVTVMERGASLRTSGSPVDVRGPAAHVAERMNIASQLRDARIRLDGMTLLDSAGRRVARVDIGTLRSRPTISRSRAATSRSSFTPRAPTTPSTSSAIPSWRSSRKTTVWT